QLIRAMDDSHRWAESYDRELVDIFSVESEVARAIADQLRAHLTGREEKVVADVPTNNPAAYDSYLRGLAFTLKTQNTPANYLGAQKHLKEAVRLDPKFALAWSLLSYVDARGYHTTNLPPTVALRNEAQQASETALSLDPNLGEAWVAKGYYQYGCVRDFDNAVRCYQRARQFLPNSSRIPESLALLARDRGQWEQAGSYFKEAERLDPRNLSLLTRHAQFFITLRRFPEALQQLDRILEIAPNDTDGLVEKGATAQAEGDLPKAAAFLAKVQPAAGDPTAWETVAYQAILERRPETVIPDLQKLLAQPDPDVSYLNGELRFWLGWAQQVAGDRPAAEKTWREARTELEAFLKDQSDNWSLLDDLALIAAGLDEKANAFALVKRAIAENPVENDAANGAQRLETLARVAAQLGEPDRAIAALQKILAAPGNGALATGMPLTPALLRLDPTFEGLRSDPRFQKLASPGKPQ
ncbi:MAG: tetratricopeptide repeat protein, partial [Chthoniobacterales bacterium]